MSLTLSSQYASLDNRLFSEVTPQKISKPYTICYNSKLAESLGISLSEHEIPHILSGSTILQNTKPIAQAYGGHQFGHFSILGDGRACLLGEFEHNNTIYDIHLKGSGKTPYSRNGDGKATVYSMLREYLISEAMHHLHIPSSRSLGVIGTHKTVYRNEPHAGAVLARIAKSHIRIGTFQYITGLQDTRLLQKFADYTIQRHYPHIAHNPQKYLDFFIAVVHTQIKLVLSWMKIGFIHGVMNTDNTTISGETIDYGPCAFMNYYNPKTTYSSIDYYGRYSFENQKYAILWNSMRFAESISPLISNSQETAFGILQDIASDFPDFFSESWYRIMGEKIGIQYRTNSDKILIDNLLSIMEQESLDYTNTFYELGTLYLTQNTSLNPALHQWIQQWKQRYFSEKNPEILRQDMKRCNPVIIPRNHLVEQALQQAQKNNFSDFNRLLDAVSKPYNESLANSIYSQAPESEEGYQTFCGT